MTAEYIIKLIYQSNSDTVIVSSEQENREQEALRRYVLGFSRAPVHGPGHMEQALLQSQCSDFSLGIRHRTFHQWQKHSWELESDILPKISLCLECNRLVQTILINNTDKIEDKTCRQHDKSRINRHNTKNVKRMKTLFFPSLFHDFIWTNCVWCKLHCHFRIGNCFATYFRV